jgi:LysM repeat protein
MPTYTFRQPTGEQFKYTADTYEEALKGARIMAPGAEAISPEDSKVAPNLESHSSLEIPSYTVKPRDTLSAIAKQQGVKVSDISGYRSGNPNLIYPGEVLTIKKSESSPIVKAVSDIIKPTEKELPGDLAEGLAKTVEEKSSPGFSEWLVKQPDWQDLFNQALKAGGMDEIKTEVEKIQTEVDRITKKYDEDIGKIEENPFMSDTQKRKNIERLKVLTNADLSPLISQYDKLKDRMEEVVRNSERTLGFMEKSYTYAATEAERYRQEQARQRDDARATIQQYVSTGAIGEFTDEQLQNIADWGVGYDVSSLKALRAAVKQGNDLKIEKTLQQMELAAQRQELATAKFEAAQAKAGGGSITDIRAENYDQAKQEAAMLFEADRLRNEDKKISPDLYDEIRAKVPASLRDDFDKWAVNMNYLSEETMRRYGIVPGKTEPTVQSVLDTLKKNFQQYKDANYSREDVENQYKAENKLEDIPEPVKKILDEVYGKPSPSWWEFWK